MDEKSKDASSQPPPTPTPSMNVVVDPPPTTAPQSVQEQQPHAPHVLPVKGDGNTTTDHVASNGPISASQSGASGGSVREAHKANGTSAGADSKEVEPTAGVDGSSLPDPATATNGEATSGDENPPADILIVDADPQEQATWNRIAYDDEVPLLDLDQLRAGILEATRATDAEMQMQKLAMEYKHYFWNQIIPESRRQLLKKKYTKDIFGHKVDQRVAMTLEEQQAQVQAAEEAIPKTEESLFGEAILFKLRCEDKNPKKETVPMSKQEDTEFIEKMHAHLKQIENKSPEEYSEIVHRAIKAFSFNLTPYIFAKMIMASETKDSHVENLCLEMVLCCARHGSAREMDLDIRTTINKFGSNFFEALAFHSVTNIMRVWGLVVSRIPRKRGGFVLKMFQSYDQLFSAAESHRNGYYLEEECPALDEDIHDVMIENYARLLTAQEEQWRDDKHLQDACTINGNLKGNTDRVICKSAGKYRQRSADKLDTKASKSDPCQDPEEAVVDDWLVERHYILISSLFILKETMYKITIPAQDESEMKKEKETVRCARRKKLKRIKRIMLILKKLGFTSILRGIQLSSLFAYNEPVLPEHDSMQKGFGPTLKFTASTKYSALSHASISVFFFLSLVRETKYGSTADLLDFSTDGSGLQYLTARKQFEIAMPYIMSLLTLSPAICKLAALRLTKLFLSILAEKSDELWDDEETLLWRFGLPQEERPVSLYGFTMMVARMVERSDDKAMRAEMYTTFQKLLRLIKSPHRRFSIVNQLITETRRIEVEAQLITELKDVLAYGDTCITNNKEEKEDMRVRFIENLYPRYFMPRKNSLALLSPMMALTMASLFLAIRDKPYNNSNSNKKKEGRVKTMNMFLRLALEVFRGINSCAEHDMRKIPQEALKVNKNRAAKMQFDVACQTLEEGKTGIVTIERILDILDGKEDNN